MTICVVTTAMDRYIAGTLIGVCSSPGSRPNTSLSCAPIVPNGWPTRADILSRRRTRNYLPFIVSTAAANLIRGRVTAAVYPNGPWLPLIRSTKTKTFPAHARSTCSIER